MILRAAARRNWLRRGVVFAAVATAFVSPTIAWAADTTISVIDGVNRQVGVSFELDAAGNPVLSYMTHGPNRPSGLMVVHCNDPICAGDDDTPALVAQGLGLGGCCRTQLQFDRDGNPVIAYEDLLYVADEDAHHRELRMVRCNDPACADGDETINIIAAAPDITSPFGVWSFRLGSSGHPSWSWVRDGQLQVLRCNDPLCAGADETPNVVDLVDPVDQTFPAPAAVMELDASGIPVIAYGSRSLKVVRCNDPACADGDEIVHTIDAVPMAVATSLRFDASGMPVVLYATFATFAVFRSDDGNELRLVHCNDPDCSGGDETPNLIETGNGPMWSGSMRLDSLGNPVISYTPSVLKVMRCNDGSCRGGDETSNLIDATPFIFETELRLDGAGNPMVAYIEQDVPNYDVRLAHCGTPDCSPDAAARVPLTPQDPTAASVPATPAPGPPMLPRTGNNDAVGVAAVMVSAAGVLLVFVTRRSRRTNAQ